MGARGVGWSGQDVRMHFIPCVSHFCLLSFFFPLSFLFSFLFSGVRACRFVYVILLI